VLRNDVGATFTLPSWQQASVPAGLRRRPPVHYGFHSYRRKLPHWRLPGATYFVTWRIARNQPDLKAAERTTVSQAICHFDRIRYELIAWVVMNDHVHVVLAPLRAHELHSIMHSWRSYTTNDLRRQGRVGRVWQPEYMDRIIRDDRELHDTVEYVLNNPQARWPHVSSYPWAWARWRGE
jgi:REP element-mobilizing transposase RayT